MNNESKVEGLPYGWDGKDWRRYKWTMRTIFREHDLLDIAEGKIKREGLTSEESEATFDKKQFKIMRMIGTTIPSHRLQQVDQYESGAEMWAALCEIYEKRQNATIRESTILRLSEELKNLRCPGSDDVQAHVGYMFRLKTDLASYGYEVNDINMKSMLLDSLPDQYEFEQLRGAVKYGGNGGTLTPEELRVLIEEAADRQSRRRINNNSRRRGGTKQGGGDSQGAGQGAGPPQTGQARVRNGGSSGQQDNSSGGRSSQRKCFVCGDTGHYKANCPERTAQQNISGASGHEDQRQKRSNYANGSTSQKFRTYQNEPGTVATVWDEAQAAIEFSPQGIVDADVEKKDPGSYSWWCFDTGSNVHIVGDRDSFLHLEDIVPESLTADVKGVAQSMITQAAGVGTVKIASVVGEDEVELCIDGVLYVPGATHGLFSMGLALEQGFDVNYDAKTKVYSVYKEGERVIKAHPAQAIWIFNVSENSSSSDNVKEEREERVVNFTVADGVGSLQVWHERLGHTCAQYLKVMVDRGLVKGMMLSQRQVKACDACHVGKQKQKRRRKKLNRGITAPNEVVYADLLFPGQGNGTNYKAVLVIMDGWSRFLTVHLLTSKGSAVVNSLMQQYVVWAERQAGRGIKKIVQREYEFVESAQFPVKQVLTDKGGEFVNGAIDGWYAARGIEHIKVGPKSSHLNPCERAHQSLMEMVRSQMHASGFPRSFWPYALKNAAYIKNRVYAKPIDGVPYERMFGVKPDIHHIRKFGSLAYVHVPVTPDKHKQDANAYVAFVVGYAEDTVGCQVYTPSERTVKFVAEVRVEEGITYRDRHQVDPADSNVSEWLTFGTIPLDDDDTLSQGSYCVDDSIVEESEYSMRSFDADEDAYSEVNASVVYEFSEIKSTTRSIYLEGGDENESDADNGDEDESNFASEQTGKATKDVVDDDIISVDAEHRSEIEFDVGDEESANESAQVTGESNVQEAVDGEKEREVIVLPTGLRKRTDRDETSSEIQKNQLGQTTKARRTGLREATERRAPARYQDFVLSNMAVRILGKDGKPLDQNTQEPERGNAVQAC